jgi:hypothetical protein
MMAIKTCRAVIGVVALMVMSAAYPAAADEAAIVGTDGSYHARYVRWNKLGEQPGFLLVDPEIRHVTMWNDWRFRVWSCTRDKRIGTLLFDSRDRKYGVYPFWHHVSQPRKDGVAFVAVDAVRSSDDWENHHIVNSIRWWQHNFFDFSARRSRSVSKRLPPEAYTSIQEGIRGHVANQDGTKVAYFERDQSQGGDLILVTEEVSTGKRTRARVEGVDPNSIEAPIGIDRDGNIYYVYEINPSPGRLQLVILMIANNAKVGEVITRPGEAWGYSSSLSQWRVRPHFASTPPPLLLADGHTVAAFIDTDPNEFRYHSEIHYFRSGKLIRAIKDPRPQFSDQNDDYATIQITADGLGVLTQKATGKNIGEVGVWDCGTGEYQKLLTVSEIAARHEWRLGRYLPIWSIIAKDKYEAGLLEVTSPRQGAHSSPDAVRSR